MLRRAPWALLPTLLCAITASFHALCLASSPSAASHGLSGDHAVPKLVLDNWSFAQGLIDLGMGVYASIKATTTLEKLEVADTATDSGSTAIAAHKNATLVREDMCRIQRSIAAVLDSQAFLVALLKQESADIYEQLDSFESTVIQGFEAAVATISDAQAAQAARDFKAKLRLVSLGYDDLIEDMVTAAGAETWRFSTFAKDDASRAEMRAEELYAWAESFLPSPCSSLNKHAKLALTPYAVAMAYAIRVKMDARLVKGHSIQDDAERTTYLERSRNIMNDFVHTLRETLAVIVTDTSLLEIGLDYRVMLTAYSTLIWTLKMSAQMMGEPAKNIQIWDDGLSGIRALLRRGGDGNTTIQLDNVKESIWWPTFADQPLEDLDIGNLRRKVQLFELCFVLGAKQQGGDDDGDDGYDAAAAAAASLHLAPDYKSALLQIPPAHSLRSALESKIAAALGGSLPHPALESFASIRNARDLRPPASAPPAAPPNSPPPAPLTMPAAFHPHLYENLTGFSQAVISVAVSANGEQVLAGHWDTIVRLWDVGTGEVLRSFTGHTGGVIIVARSPDGKRAVSGSVDTTVRIWDIESGTEQSVLKGHSDWVIGVAVSPDGSTVASGGRDGKLNLWSIESGEHQATLVSQNSGLYCVAYSPDGQTLVSGSSGGAIRVWSVRSGNATLERTITKAHAGVVRWLEFTPDGERLVSSGYDGSVKIWDWRTGEMQMKLMGHNGAAYGVTVFPDGARAASCSHDKTIKIWNLHSGELEHSFQAHTNPVNCVAVSRDGQTMVSGTQVPIISIWKFD